MLLSITLTIFVTTLIYFFVEEKFQFWKNLGFVSVPTDFFFGIMKNVGIKISNYERLDEIYKKYKGKTEAVGVFLFLSPRLFILDLELVKNILIGDFSSFHDRGSFYNKEDPLSANLVEKLTLHCTGDSDILLNSTKLR